MSRLSLRNDQLKFIKTSGKFTIIVRESTKINKEKTEKSQHVINRLDRSLCSKNLPWHRARERERGMILGFILYTCSSCSSVEGRGHREWKVQEVVSSSNTQMFDYRQSFVTPKLPCGPVILRKIKMKNEILCDSSIIIMNENYPYNYTN